ncbi:MAG: hypothetical protein M3P82_05445, partial [Bacteroidota bacterium]|nr:hypothetical protein [Bacteroidota bacterium]
LSEKNVDRSWTERIIKMKSWKTNIKKIENETKKLNMPYEYIASDDCNLAPLLQYYFEGKSKIYLINDPRFRYINSLEYNPNMQNKNLIIVSYNDDWKNSLNEKFTSLKVVGATDLLINDTKFSSVTILWAEGFISESNF